MTASNLHDVFPDFSPLSDVEIKSFTQDGSMSRSSTASLTDLSYQPNQWIPLEVARVTFAPSDLQKIATESKGSLANQVEVKRLLRTDGKSETMFDTWSTASAMIDVAEAHDSYNSVDQVSPSVIECQDIRS